MLRSIPLPLVLAVALCASTAVAQTKKPAAAPTRSPAAGDPSIAVTVFMRDPSKNELLVATRIWPAHPEYNAAALARLFAVMKALEPPYKQDDEVAYSWSQKNKVTKCTIYLESADAGVKNGTGATVGCEVNGVSSLAVTSGGDPKSAPSSSLDPKHVADVMAMFKKQWDRARTSLPK